MEGPSWALWVPDALNHLRNHLLPCAATPVSTIVAAFHSPMSQLRPDGISGGGLCQCRRLNGGGFDHVALGLSDRGSINPATMLLSF